MAKTQVTTPFELYDLDTVQSLEAAVSFVAGQHRACVVSGVRMQAALPAAGAKIYGVVDNAPAAEEMATVITRGIVVVEAGAGGIAVGDEVTVDNAGRFVVAATGNAIAGKCMAPAASGQFGSVDLGYLGQKP